ncbi:hypothetical protein BDR07DRAFT_1422543 [Suillus spraguei]|nr:hypothetical protein BDR07DRAFT_1439843 [Suillus spraguei]KAG2356687.1 hypothetical protein BDR07DRAFT_1422543 [Suillus spraguei]
MTNVFLPLAKSSYYYHCAPVDNCVDYTLHACEGIWFVTFDRQKQCKLHCIIQIDTRRRCINLHSQVMDPHWF